MHTEDPKISTKVEVKGFGVGLRDQELTIGQVADRAGIAVSAIRFYEEKGLISSERTDGGQRRFHRDVLRRLGFIQAAQQVGLSLQDIGAALATLPEHAGPTGNEWAAIASDWRPMLDQRIEVLTKLRDQLDGCIGCGCLSLEKCRLRNPGDKLAATGRGPRYLLP